MHYAKKLSNDEPPLTLTPFKGPPRPVNFPITLRFEVISLHINALHAISISEYPFSGGLAGMISAAGYAWYHGVLENMGITDSGGLWDSSFCMVVGHWGREIRTIMPTENAGIPS